jgi:hypothetical protein
MATEKTILNKLHDLAAAYPQQAERISQNMIDLWQRMMADIPEDIFIKAVDNHIAASKWLPSVAEIREAGTKIVKHDAGSNPKPFDTGQPGDGLWEMAMGDFNDCLAGVITDAQLEASRPWGWYQRMRQPLVENDKTRQAEKIYQQECAEMEHKVREGMITNG